MIETADLKFTYPNGYQAVQGISLTIDKGDIFGFLGPNGAGKTTTIRMLTGLLKPTSGSITVGNTDVAKHPDKTKAIIGVLPESHGFYNYMTAKEYLSFFAELYGVDKKESGKRIDILLEKVGLVDKAKVPIGHYSRGMKQRLGLAKVLINKPSVIFLDEPTLGLDPIGQRDIYDLIRDINHEMQITVFITSHLLKDIDVLCNKVCIVDKGRIIEQGEIGFLKAKYSAASIEDVFFKLIGEKGEEVE